VAKSSVARLSRVRRNGAAILNHRLECTATIPLTRFAASPLSTLSHIRAFTLVFDELWGEGRKTGSFHKTALTRARAVKLRLLEHLGIANQIRRGMVVM
jgi:hypothetical protein